MIIPYNNRDDRGNRFADIESHLLESALMALEEWLLTKAERGDADTVDVFSRLLRESNNVAAFIKFSTASGDKCLLISLYSSYVQFCISWGERNNTERFSRFRAMLTQLGYETTSTTVLGLKMECSEDDY